MRVKRPGRLTWALGLLSLGVAFAQRPGLTVTDTRIDLTADPMLFLSRVTQVFTGTGDLGHVQSGQFVGYLMPMGPWYALGHLAGVSTWIVQRLWLAALLFAAAYGVVRLLDAMYEPRRGAPHAVAAVLYSLNPFVAVYVSRATVTLLALAILPWLMLLVARGLHDPRSWRWPAAIGLLVALGGGGVNAAQITWIALGPLGLIVWEATAGGAGWSAARRFGLRTLACIMVGSAWWIIPVALQGAYGADFLSFTEQPSTIWATTSASESLRLLGYWPMYLGVGYGAVAPQMEIGQTYLFDSLAVVGSFMVPAVALLELRRTRRWYYAPFFGLLACVTVVVLAAGFPHGTAFSDTLRFAYSRLPTLRFLRTSYKAAPVLALSVAVLGGVATRALLANVRETAREAPGAFVAAGVRKPTARLRLLVRRGGRYITLPAIGVALLACAAVAWALPLLDGHAIDRSLAYGQIPSAWRQAISTAGAADGENQRALVLPGELYGYYRWGRTWDSVAPAVSREPVAIRQATRWANPRSAQLLDGVDDAVQQARLVPGELQSLLQLLGVGQVLVPTDALDIQSGGLDPADVATALTGQRGFAAPLASYGPSRTFVPMAGRDGPQRRLPELRRYAISGGAGLVRVERGTGATVLDGGPGGVIELAADGQLRRGEPTFYAADLSFSRLAQLLASGARLVFSDSNRRQVVAATYVRQDLGPTLTASTPLPRGVPAWNLFPAAGASAQTVASYSGLADLTAPQGGGAQLFPAFRPEAGLDGDPNTSWLPDPSLPASQWWMELRLAQPRAMGTVTIVPKPVSGSLPLSVAISVNGGAERALLLRPGPNRVAIDTPSVQSLRFRLAGVTAADLAFGAGGLEEISIPGLTPVRESLVLPRLLAGATSHMNTSHDEISVALSRSTADFPTRVGKAQGVPVARTEIAAGDPESGIRRTIALPAARTFNASGWATVSPVASDHAIDELVGSSRGWVLTSSSRFEGVPGSRASSAFDRNLATAWVGDMVPSALALTNPLPLQPPLPWLSIRSPHAVHLSSFWLRPGAVRYATPARVQVVTDAGVSRPLSVGPAGRVRLPQAVVTRSLLIRILAVHPPTGPAAARLLRAVAISEIRSPFHPPRPRRQGSFQAPCGALQLTGRHGYLPLTVSGTVQQLDGGDPLRLSVCGGRRRLLLPAGASTLDAAPGSVFRADHLLLDSPPPEPLPVLADGTALLTGGLTATGVPRGAQLSSSRPGWLVLAESYSPQWRAFCKGTSGAEQSLGRPLPIDGFANGWPVDSSCMHVRFDFAPERTANFAYIVSLVGLPLLVALVVLSRPRRLVQPLRDREPRDRDPMVRFDWLRALTAGTISTIVIGYLFALPIGPLALPILLLGTTSRRLFKLGGLLLLAVPVAYLIRAAPNYGGYNFNYAYDNLAAHWLAVAGICAIAGGCLLELTPRRRARLDPALNPPDARAPSGPQPL